MKNRAVQVMFALQYKCNIEDIEVENLVRFPDGSYEYKVSIDTGKHKETVFFTCKCDSRESSRYMF